MPVQNGKQLSIPVMQMDAHVAMKKMPLLLPNHLAPLMAGKEIKGLWSKIISDGFSDVQYIDPKIEVLDAESAVLSSEWIMNNAQGIITKELWIAYPDGTALLREDFFEVTSSLAETNILKMTIPLRQDSPLPKTATLL